MNPTWSEGATPTRQFIINRIIDHGIVALMPSFTGYDFARGVDWVVAYRVDEEGTWHPVTAEEFYILGDKP